MDSPLALLEVALRSAIVYLVIILAFRLAGKRHLSQLSLIDFALVLLVSNAVQNAMVGNDVTVTGGLVAALTLIAINIILTRFLFREHRMASWLAGEPRLLVRNGKPVDSNMMHEGIRYEELEEQMREHGVESIEDVRTAILETDGTISIIPMPNGTPNGEPAIVFVHKRRRGRRGEHP